MLKKRFIGVITVRNGWAVQSFGYHRYLPVGNPVVVAQNLDRWGVDEILVLAIDRSAKSLGPDFELINSLSVKGLSTPLIYGGGICNAKQASMVIRAGVERICVDAALSGDYGRLKEISMHTGSQALIASLPLSIEASELQWFDYVTRTRLGSEKDIEQIFKDGLFSEALIIDWKNEGMQNGFDMALLHRFPVLNLPLIAFGGLSEVDQIEETLSIQKVVAVGVGNFLYYTEHSVQNYKERVASKILRPSAYLGTVI